MWKRLGLGLIKGLLIGGAVGAGLQLGLGWTEASGLLGFLIAMGVAGTAGVFAGRPPWLEGAWIEALLKGVVGVGLGAGAYYGLSQIPASVQIPFPSLPGTHAFDALPAVFAPAIAGLYGALVELDNSGEAEDEGTVVNKRRAKARVKVDDLDLEEEPRRSRSKKKQKRA